MPARFGGRRVFPFYQYLLFACLTTSLGCYKYVPTTIDAVPVGSNIRAVLSSDAREDLRARTGVDATEVDGRLLEENDEQILISVPAVRVANPFGSETLRQRVDLPRSGIVNVQLRKLDKLKTVGFIGAIAGAATFITMRAFDEGEPGSPTGTPPGPDEHIIKRLFRVTLFRW